VNVNAADKECVSDETLVCAHLKWGWTTSPTFGQYLDWLATYYKDEIAAGLWIQVILDLHPVHRLD
jgi:hypothetical protein